MVLNQQGIFDKSPRYGNGVVAFYKRLHLKLYGWDGANAHIGMILA
jgi:hypothetical protein